jgi:diaminohydroxyphosphoribosylaminopyrimidine deaminase / 5-amino-6-(5-phosphoribosylamino)uracil reductase
MGQGLALARQGLGRTAPNPPVGCVLVRQGVVVGRGFHPKAGEPHAEVFALREAGEQARGATAYVTLEPCSHQGRTPPCADALIAAGVARVVVAALDPNPLVAGQGLSRLAAAGIAVRTGVLEEQALAQQAGFRSRVARGRPWVIYKYAMTLDGKIAALNGDSRWVTSEAARALVHLWRDECDAIAVGSGTVLSDDPSLTARTRSAGRDPVRVVFDRRRRVSPTSRSLGQGSVLVTAKHASQDVAAYQANGVTVLPASSLQDALAGLADLGLDTVLLEGGAGLAGALLEADLIDEVRAFVSPKLLGAGLSPMGQPEVSAMRFARELKHVRVEQVGSDVLICGLLHEIPVLPNNAVLPKPPITKGDG